MEDTRCKIVAIEVDDLRCNRLNDLVIEMGDFRCKSLLNRETLEIDDPRCNRMAIRVEDPRCQSLHMDW